MEAIQSKSANEALPADEKSRLKTFKERLDKIDDPDSGMCSICGNPIPPARLIFLPDTDRCVNCA